MKEAGEFAGAHVLSMVHAHYPLIDFTCFAKGYPKEVGLQEAGELRGQLSKLATMIIGDINLCGTSALGSLSRPPGTTISTSQSQARQSSSKEQPEPTVTTSQTPAA
jgi:hypothetical protein